MIIKCKQDSACWMQWQLAAEPQHQSAPVFCRWSDTVSWARTYCTQNWVICDASKVYKKKWLQGECSRYLRCGVRGFEVWKLWRPAAKWLTLKTGGQRSTHSYVSLVQYMQLMYRFIWSLHCDMLGVVWMIQAASTLTHGMSSTCPYIVPTMHFMTLLSYIHI